jgi:hypothetical protein
MYSNSMNKNITQRPLRSRSRSREPVAPSVAEAVATIPPSATIPRTNSNNNTRDAVAGQIYRNVTQRILRSRSRNREPWRTARRRRRRSLIQSHWRRFVKFSSFLIALDSSITIQAAFRSFSDRKAFATVLSAVLVPQCAFRVFVAEKKTEILGNTRMLE